MSPKKLILSLWFAVAAVALAIFLAPGKDGYREYSVTQVVLPSADVRPDFSDPVAVVPTDRAISVAPLAPAVAPGISLGGVAGVLTDGLRSPAATVAGAAVAPSAPSAPVSRPAVPLAAPLSAGPASEWRRASSVSSSEIEAAVERDAMSPQTAVAFRSACGHDHDLHFDAKGKPLYACSMHIQVGPDTTGITSVPSYPLADTFLLHSRPTATRKIYLDFDGHVTTGTPWNGGRDATLTTPPFSLDANPEFSNAEKAVIQEAFRRVAEHFAPWNVDVTTEDPGVEALRKTSAGDFSYGIRVVIGPKSFDTSAAGIAYLNSFSDSIDNPCFTFATTGWTAALIAGVTSHEVGHTVSLVHQGQSPGSGEYFGGHGSGALSWSPIMGNGLRPVNQWAKGEYQDATSTQDNLAAIANPGSGVPLLADDHGNTLETATLAPGVTASIGGVIGSTTDVDLIKFNCGRGPLVITPKVSLVAPNLRLQVRVLDSAGAVLGTYVGTGAAGNMAPRPITVNILTAGVHYIELDGIGNGSGVTEGYTEYGSVGFYSLEASWPDPVNRPPVADASLTSNATYDYQTQQSTAVNFNGTLSTDPDGVIVRYLWDFKDVFPSRAEGPTVSYRYKAPGTYRPTLTVFDDMGASASTTLTVTVTGPTRPPTCSLALISGSFARQNSVRDTANATILVQDQYGNPLRRALVHVSTTGLVAMKRTVYRTNELGQVNVTTPGFRRGARGSVVFTVATVESPNRPYVTTTAAPVVTVAPTVTVTR